MQLVVTPDESGVDFGGNNYFGKATGGAATGILDKSTQTLKIVPIAANKIFRLEPRVQGLSLNENEESQTETQELTAEEKTEKTRELNLKYSTKKLIQQAWKLESLQNVGGPQTQWIVPSSWIGIQWMVFLLQNIIKFLSYHKIDRLYF